jgi:hypothetical protein
MAIIKQTSDYGAFSRVPSPALKEINYEHRTCLRKKHKVDTKALCKQHLKIFDSKFVGTGASVYAKHES